MSKSTENRLRWIVLLAALLATASATSADKAYISVDESGRPVVSDTPPSTGTVEEVRVLPKPQPVDAAKEQEEVERVKQKADQMAAERKQKQDEQAAAKEQEERQQVSCAASRSRLQQLESQPPNRRLVVNPDGTSQRVSAEEMQGLIAAAKRQMVEDCGSLDTPQADTMPQANTTKRSSGSQTSGEREKR